MPASYGDLRPWRRDRSTLWANPMTIHPTPPSTPPPPMLLRLSPPPPPPPMLLLPPRPLPLPTAPPHRSRRVRFVSDGAPGCRGRLAPPTASPCSRPFPAARSERDPSTGS